MRNYNTQQRKILIDFFLKHTDEALSATQIIEELKGSNVSKSAIYRNLLLLEKEGDVKSIGQSGDKTTFYQYVGNIECKGIIHMSCVKCGRISHLSQNVSMQLAKALNNENSFLIDNNETMIYGLCKNCRGSI